MKFIYAKNCKNKSGAFCFGNLNQSVDAHFFKSEIQVSLWERDHIHPHLRSQASEKLNLSPQRWRMRPQNHRKNGSPHSFANIPTKFTTNSFEPPSVLEHRFHSCFIIFHRFVSWRYFEQTGKKHCLEKLAEKQAISIFVKTMDSILFSFFSPSFLLKENQGSVNGISPEAGQIYWLLDSPTLQGSLQHLLRNLPMSNRFHAYHHQNMLDFRQNLNEYHSQIGR